MNILTDQLPTAVEIDGREYKLNTDFRVCLRIILAFEDPGLTQEEKQWVLLANLYPVLPDNLTTAFELGMKFMDGGHDGEEKEEMSLRLYSFSQDSNFIFAAFRQTHGIDLETTDLHWWKFLALFMDLGVDTTFCSLTGLRKRLATGEATDAEKKMAEEMSSVIELKEVYERPTELYELEDTFMQQLTGGK